MKRADDNRAERVKGTITLPDGTTSEFVIYDFGWEQFDAVPDRLSRSVPIVEAIEKGLRDDSRIVGEDEPDYDDD